MPDEVMTEMWIDFPSRRLRVKCGLHDALGWSGSFAAWNSRHGRTVDRQKATRGVATQAGAQGFCKVWVSDGPIEAE